VFREGTPVYGGDLLDLGQFKIVNHRSHGSLSLHQRPSYIDAVAPGLFLEDVLHLLAEAFELPVVGLGLPGRRWLIAASDR
jgi:hypothetical protein